MTSHEGSCPLPQSRVVDDYFLEHRSKLIDVAAFLDRVDRATSPGAPPDYRVAALRRAIGILVDGGSDRARRILESLSDPTVDAAPESSGAAATGAYGGPGAGGGCSNGSL